MPLVSSSRPSSPKGNSRGTTSSRPLRTPGPIPAHAIASNIDEFVDDPTLSPQEARARRLGFKAIGDAFNGALQRLVDAKQGKADRRYYGGQTGEYEDVFFACLKECFPVDESHENESHKDEGHDDRADPKGIFSLSNCAKPNLPGIWADPKRTMEHDLGPPSELHLKKDGFQALEEQYAAAKLAKLRAHDVEDNVPRRSNDVWSDPEAATEFDSVKDPRWFIRHVPWNKEIGPKKPHRHGQKAKHQKSCRHGKTAQYQKPSVKDAADHGWDRDGNNDDWGFYLDEDGTAGWDNASHSEELGGWNDGGGSKGKGTASWVDSGPQTADDAEGGQSDESQPDTNDSTSTVGRQTSLIHSEDLQTAPPQVAGPSTPSNIAPGVPVVGQTGHAQLILRQGSGDGSFVDACPVGAYVIRYDGGGAGEGACRTITVMKALATGWVVVSEISGRLDSGEIRLFPFLS